jgi:ribonuclease D
MDQQAMAIKLHDRDLPVGLDLGPAIAVDTETMGLRPERDRLCLVQLSAGDGECHMVRFRGAGEAAPNLVRLLSDPTTLKIFHFARFDLAMLRRHLGVDCRPVYCTKIASKLARTYTDRHGLKDLCQELLGIDLSKQMQSSDWGARELSEAQLSYAANDVLHLHRLRERLDAMLEREGRTALAAACFEFLPRRVELDLAGWPDADIFAY